MKVCDLSLLSHNCHFQARDILCQIVCLTRIVAALIFFLSISNPCINAVGVIDSSFVIFHYGGTDSTSKTGGFLTPLGDVNGDGIDDIGVGSLSPDGTYLFYGGYPIDSIPDQFFVGVWAQIGDVDGDGLSDLMTTRLYDRYDQSAGANYFYLGFPESLSTIPSDSAYSSDTTEFLGCTRAVGDVSGGPELDILSWKYSPGVLDSCLYYEDIFLDRVPDWKYSPQNWSHFIADAGFIDFNGDGMKDIFLGLHPLADPDSNGLVLIFYGPVFPDSPGLVIKAPPDFTRHRQYFAQTTGNIGDINADGLEDLGVAYADTGLIYFGGTVGDTLYDIRLLKQGNRLTSIGDINKDGFSDLAAYGYAYSGRVDVYLGGLHVDGVMDDEVVEYWDLPVWEQMDLIGYRISAAGDFNGDSIDDFMFATQNYCCPSDADPGEVFVVRGAPNIKTRVDDDSRLALPLSVILHQNYPNPFNPSTTILIELPSRESVELKVADVLGRTVTVIYSGDLVAGLHTFEWNGRNNSQVMCASGVYVVSLTSSHSTVSRKMILLK